MLQIAGTLASVRKVPPDAIFEELEQSGDAATFLGYQRECDGDLPPVPEQSLNQLLSQRPVVADTKRLETSRRTSSSS
jgi:gamma-tubulin complex component 2